MPVVQLQHETRNSPTFARHETFPPRNGWLKKGFDALCKDVSVFNRDDAPIVLGVGKNMAKAIRYWCLAFKLAEEVTDKATKTKHVEPTEFGQRLLSDTGWDPYLEDEGSLWLLHWKLLKNPCTATTWSFVFNHLRHPEFSTDDLLSELQGFIDLTWPDSSFSETTLGNDVSCLTRMYCREEGSKNVSEETISSPFAGLNLLTRLVGGKHIAFHIGAKSNLPPHIVAAASLEYASETRRSEQSINVSQLLYGHGGPGLAFKLSESALYSALETVATKRKDTVLSDTAGVVQLQFSGDPAKIAEAILGNYFGAIRR
ncbi:MAG: DUF4007 family protein [Candidatus Obscuribacterales bacterium]|nr:DUF4007 family protein [Candidatus Obscuribacterales bacterium]